MNTKQEITDLTVCRALFAAWVFTYHVDLHCQFSLLLGPFGGLIRRGYLGVDGFFLLSGFILTRVHPELTKSSKGSLRFWGKRLARIYPLHLATILILIGLLAAGSLLGLAPRDPGRLGAVALVQNLLLIHGWGFGDTLAWNYPSWSVSTEWAGYLLFPLLCLALGRIPLLVSGQFGIICLPLIGLLAYMSGQGLNLTGGLVLLRFLPEFIWGMSTAGIVTEFADNLPARWIALFGLIIALLGVFFGIDVIAVLGLWIIIMALAMRADAERPALLKWPILRWLGRLSYAFYMSFGIIEMVLAVLFRHLGQDPANAKLIYAGAMTGLTFILAVLLHVAVETPCRRLGDRLLTPRPPLAAAAQRL